MCFRALYKKLFEKEVTHKKVISFAAKHVHQQLFPFSYSIMNYIFENANSNIFKKFNLSCKYFFAKFRFVIIDHLLDNTDFIPPRFRCYSFYARRQDEFKILPSNLWVTKQLFFADADLNFYQSMMPKISRCDIKRLNIHTYEVYFSHHEYERILFEYFKQITAAGTIDDIHLCNTAVVYSDGTPVPFEEIYKCIPNATIIKFVF